MTKLKQIRELRAIIRQQELVIDWLILQLEKAKARLACAEERKE